MQLRLKILGGAVAALLMVATVPSAMALPVPVEDAVTEADAGSVEEDVTEADGGTSVDVEEDGGPVEADIWIDDDVSVPDGGEADVWEEPDGAFVDAGAPDGAMVDIDEPDVDPIDTWIDPDGDSPDVSVPDGAMVDIGEPDAIEPDAIEPDATPGGPFGISECWDDECGDETTACQADPKCVEYMGCFKAEDAACMQAISDANPESVTLHQAVTNCGWSACNDPTGASCSDPGKDGAANRCDQWDNLWPCNCDESCEGLSDCCSDFEATCGGGTGAESCAGICDSYTPDNGLACSCDDQCSDPEFDDCCGDYEAECTGACTPDCTGKTCGDDGCGGTCGACTGGQTCNAAGQCAGACVDACAASETGCEGDTQWTCLTGASGCYEKVTTDCAPLGKVCVGGVCQTDGTDSDASGGPDSSVGDTAGPGVDTGGTGGTTPADDDGCQGGSNGSLPVSLAMAFGALAMIRRRTGVRAL